MPWETWREPYRSWGDRASQFVASDAFLMALLGIGFICKGVSYFLIGDRRVLLHALDVSSPTMVSMVSWCTVGVLLLACAPVHRTLIGRGVFVAAVVALALWGALYISHSWGLFLNRGVWHWVLAAVILRSVWKTGWAQRRAIMKARKAVDRGGRE